MKKFLVKFRKSKWSKVFACCLICTVFISMFAISSSAAMSFDLVKFNFSFYNGACRVYHPDFVSGEYPILYNQGVSYITSVDLNSESLGYSDGTYPCYYFVMFVSKFSRITINGVSYSGTMGSEPPKILIPWSSSKTYSFVGSSTYYVADLQYSYLVGIPAFDLDSYSLDYLSGFENGVVSSQAENIWFPKGYENGVLSDDAKELWYPQGFESGVSSEDAKNKWYPQGYEAGYAAGLADGSNANASQMLGQNLIGDTLSAPIHAINSVTLFTAPNGVTVTLGSVFGALIGLTLFLAFLKMFGG